MIARFTFTRGADGRFAVTSAEAVPLRIELGADAVTRAAGRPGDASSASPPSSTGGAPWRRGWTSSRAEPGAAH